MFSQSAFLRHHPPLLEVSREREEGQVTLGAILSVAVLSRNNFFNLVPSFLSRPCSERF